MKNETETVDKLERFLIDNKKIDLETLKEIYPFLSEIKKQLSIHVVGSSKRVKILDQGNGTCGLI
jgi:Na+-translocating ferredoxin:NAD+ oxidoreductase RnfC subunit